MSWNKFKARLRHLTKRLKGVNEKIRKRRRKGQKTPELAEIKKHIAAKIEYLRAHPPPKPQSTTGFATFDGHTVPAWIVHEVCEPARKSGMWKGSVISGYRTPAYSESLCRAMCGAPQCPGRCAGRATNHACPPDGKPLKPRGAIDVTDSAGLQRWCRAHGNPLHGNGEFLPYDTPHFSASGR